MNPYAAEIVATSDLVPGAMELAQDQLRFVTWEARPRFRAEGRTAWSRLPRPVPVDGGSIPSIRSLKLKGVGLGSADGDGVPPPLGVYHHRRSHFAITDAGDVVTVWPEDAPVGAIFLDRAQLEFDNARHLSEVGCPCVVPIALYRYPELRCSWAPDRQLGAVLTGLPVEEPHRLDVLFECDGGCEGGAASTFRALRASLGSSRVQAVRRLALEYGRTLSEFHEAGHFRHNAHPVNLLYSEEITRVCLVDLDSSRRLERCAPARRPMEVLRDISSGVYSFADVIIRPQTVGAFPPSEIALDDVGDELLRGYFGDGAPTLPEPCRSYLSETHARAYEVRTEHACCLQGMHPRGPVQIDLAHLYPAVMAGLVEAYDRSSLATRFPLPSDAATIRDALVATSEQARNVAADHH